MSTATNFPPISVEDYLAGELESTVKHEYVGGYVYAMAGARNVHNLIASNVLGSLHAALRDSDCRAFNSDTKIRIRLSSQVRFYYPDCSVICDPNPQSDTFQDQPTIIVEVLSPTTRRTDEGEKREAYQTIPSLSAYVLIDQDRPAVTVYRRTDGGFARESHADLQAVILLPEIEVALPLDDVYDRVEFGTENLS